MKIKLIQKIQTIDWVKVKRKILEETQRYGLTGLGFILWGVARLLYGKNSCIKFNSTSIVQWEVPSFKYYILPDTIAGIDAALKANLSPSDALDKLAREAGIPEEDIKGTYKI